MAMIERFYAKFIPSDQARYATVARQRSGSSGPRRWSRSSRRRGELPWRAMPSRLEPDGKLTAREIITLKQAQELAEDLGGAGVEPQELQGQINAIATFYCRFLGIQDTKRPKRVGRNSVA